MIHIFPRESSNSHHLDDMSGLYVSMWSEKRLSVTFGNGKLDFSDGAARVEMFGASLGTVHDGVATVQLPGIVQGSNTSIGGSITAIGNPSVGLHEDSRSEVLVSVPPVTWARCGAACTENALVHTVELLAIFLGLKEFSLGRLRCFGLQPWLDGLVLGVEAVHIRNQVFDNFHVRKRVDWDRLVRGLNAAQACKGVGTVDVHGATTTNALSTRATKGKSWVCFVLDLDERVQHHGPTFFHVNVEALCLRGVIAVWVVAIYLKFLKR